MAGYWIKWTKGLTRKPEVVRMSAALRMSRREVAACLMELWEWCDDNTTTGHAPGVTESFVDELVSVTGFASALRSAGWLSGSADGIDIPNFDRHNGETAKSRALALSRKQTERGRLSRECHGESVTKLGPQRRAEEITKDPLTPRGGKGTSKVSAGQCEGKDDEKVDPAGFARWWSAWPSHERKANRTKCLRKWRREKLEAKSTLILAALGRCKTSRDWAKNGGEFIPGPLPWLNKTPWETDPAEMVGGLLTGIAPKAGPDDGFERTPVTEDDIRLALGIAPGDPLPAGFEGVKL